MESIEAVSLEDCLFSIIFLGAKPFAGWFHFQLQEHGLQPRWKGWWTEWSPWAARFLNLASLGAPWHSLGCQSLRTKETLHAMTVASDSARTVFKSFSTVIGSRETFRELVQHVVPAFFKVQRFFEPVLCWHLRTSGASKTSSRCEGLRTALSCVVHDQSSGTTE